MSTRPRTTSSFLSFGGPKRSGAWRDPVRKLKTLESFSRTEEDGGRDIAAALKVVHDPELKGHLQRHAQDELRHAELFRNRALELRREGVSPDADEGTDKSYDLSRGRKASEVNAHGFGRVGLADELGEVAYVAMLHVAEKRAASLFRDLSKTPGLDSQTRAIFESILKDEHYHVAYTGTLLQKWKKDGRGQEVKRALSQARGNRFLGAWKRFGARSGAQFSRVVLGVLYFTILLPFGLVARASRREPGWRERADESGARKMSDARPGDRLRSTY
jgi:rubrerythrin